MFGCLTKLGAKWVELVQKFVPRSRVGIFHNERIRSTPLHHKLTFWCVSYYLGAFGTFGYLTKLGAKRAELVQKFVPRSRVGIFRNEHTRSTPLYPKLMFWGVSYYLCAFGNVWLPSKTRCKTDRTSAKSSCPDVALEFFTMNYPPHWTTNWRFGTICTIWVHSGPFGCLTKLGAKRAELVQKFVKRSRIGIFRNECTRSTPLDNKLTFWCISYYLCAFGTVCLP